MLAMGIPKLHEGHWVSGGLFSMLGLAAWGLVAYVFIKGWWDGRKSD